MKLKTVTLRVYEIGDVVRVDLSKSNRRCKSTVEGVERALIIGAKLVSYNAGPAYKIMTDDLKAVQLSCEESVCVTEYLGHIDMSILLDGANGD